MQVPTLEKIYARLVIAEDNIVGLKLAIEALLKPKKKKGRKK